MKSMIKELWHGNVCPQSDIRNTSPEMKQLMEYMARHHDDLLKTMTDEQKEIFEKFDDCCSESAKDFQPFKASSKSLSRGSMRTIAIMLLWRAPASIGVPFMKQSRSFRYITKTS